MSYWKIEWANEKIVPEEAQSESRKTENTATAAVMELKAQGAGRERGGRRQNDLQQHRKINIYIFELGKFCTPAYLQSQYATVREPPL